MTGRVRVSLLVTALVLGLTVGPASAVQGNDPTGSPIDPVPEEDAVDPVRRTWNHAMTEASSTLQPVQRTVDPVVVAVEEATGEDVCEADFGWRTPLGDGGEWNSAPLWCPGGDPSTGSGSPAGGSSPVATRASPQPAPDPSHGVRGPEPGSATQATASVADGTPPIQAHDPGAPMALAGLVVAAGAAIWLYRRLSRSALTDNPNRDRILQILKKRPGRTCRELADSLDVAYGTARYHLRLLDEFDHVVSRRFGRRVRYFVQGNGEDATDKQVAAALSIPSKRRILQLLDARGQVPSGELADAVGVARSTCSEHLRDLTEAELVDRERSGRKVFYSLEEGVAASLEQGS